MDLDLLASGVGVCLVAVSIECPSAFTSGLSCLVICLSLLALRLSFVGDRTFQIPARRCLLSRKIPPPNLPVPVQPAIPPKVDTLLREVISLSLRDFVFSWFAPPLALKTQNLSDIATTLAWHIVCLAQRAFHQLDLVTLLSQDITIKLHSHFKTAREKRGVKEKEYMRVECRQLDCNHTDYRICHQSSEERRFLKRAAIIIVQELTPRSVWRSELFSELMGDVLSNMVLHPLLTSTLDPAYLYELLLSNIGNLGSSGKEHKVFTQAKTYEDFIKKINRETDLAKLRQLRYKVIAEIMQAMTIDSLKQGDDFDGLLSQINSKSYRLSTRNLGRYINQCKVAKSTCEKRIQELTKLRTRAEVRFRDNSETKLLELDEILTSPYVLPFFVQFLEKQGDYGPLKLWLLVEECKVAARGAAAGAEGEQTLYELIRKVYQDHLTVTSPYRAHQVSRHLVRMAEAYVERESGYWQFVLEIQEEVYKMLLDQHHKPFLISSQYMQCVCQTEGRRNERTSVSSTESEDDASQYSEECTKLSILRDELRTKEVLLDTLDIMNYCSAEEQNQIGDEIRNLKIAISQLEHHTERTRLWWQHLGRWEVVDEGGEFIPITEEPLYTLSVRMREPSASSTLLPQEGTPGFRLTTVDLSRSRTGSTTGTPTRGEEEGGAHVHRFMSIRPADVVRPVTRSGGKEGGRKDTDTVSYDSIMCTPGPSGGAGEVEVLPPPAYSTLTPRSISVEYNSPPPVHPSSSLTTSTPRSIGNSTFYRGSPVEPTSSDQDTISVESGDLPPLLGLDDESTISVELESCSHDLSTSMIFEVEEDSSLAGEEDQEPPVLPTHFLAHEMDQQPSSSSRQSDYFPHVYPESGQFLPSKLEFEQFPSEEAGRFSSSKLEDAEFPSHDSNQCDDEKLGLIVSEGEDDPAAGEMSVPVGGVSEAFDPYLVIDINSLPNEHMRINSMTSSGAPSSTLSKDPDSLGSSGTSSQTAAESGWIITHTLSDVKKLYNELKGCKSVGYPSSFPVAPPRDEDSLLTSREHLADFLNFLLRDKTLSQNEFVYRFFNPTCEPLYRSSQAKGADTVDYSEGEEDRHKDSIAIPFYSLLGEIFEIHGHLQWLRRQIIYLVRITFGGTIERQIYRAMAWATSEQQVVWYLQTLKTALWPAGPVPAERDAVGKEAVRAKVRMTLLNTPPQLLVVLFGASKTRKGLVKLLDAMEDERQTRQLGYTAIELLLLHLVGQNTRVKGSEVRGSEVRGSEGAVSSVR